MLADTAAFGVAGVFVGTGVFIGTGVVVGVVLFATAGIMAPELAPRFWQGEAATETITARHATAFTIFTRIAMEMSKERTKIARGTQRMGGLDKQEVEKTDGEHRV